jgi:HAD superfamily hydrolase (TIGR01509 family)
MGIPYVRTHAFLSQRAPLPDATTFWPQLRTELFSLIDTELAVFPDALATAVELRERGVRLAVASSSPRERLDHTLARAGLEFPVTVAGDEVEHGKPAPDMFLAAAARLEVEPARCVVVEDSAPGVAAGLAARMPTLAVRRAPHADLTGADAVVDALTAEAILALVRP